MILWDMGLMAGDNPVAVLRLAPLILGEFANTAPDFLSPECLVDLGETGWFAMFIKKNQKGEEVGRKIGKIRCKNDMLPMLGLTYCPGRGMMGVWSAISSASTVSSSAIVSSIKACTCSEIGSDRFLRATRVASRMGPGTLLIVARCAMTAWAPASHNSIRMNCKNVRCGKWSLSEEGRGRMKVR